MKNISKTVVSTLLLSATYLISHSLGSNHQDASEAIKTIFGGLAVNWASEGIPAALREIKERLFIHRTPLEKTYANAVNEAIGILKTKYQEKYGIDDKAQIAFVLLDRLIDIVSELDVLPESLNDQSIALELDQALDELLYGHDERVQQFIKNSLLIETTRCLNKELLKDDDARRQYQTWLIGTIYSRIEVVEKYITDTSALLSTLNNDFSLRNALDSHLSFLLESITDEVQQSTAATKEIHKTVHSIESRLERFESNWNWNSRIPLGSRPEFKNCTVSFLEMYLGSSENPEPFGGRDSKLNELDAWLKNSKERRYRFLYAPAGRGKSALLARWLERVIVTNETHVAYISVSPRFSSITEDVVFGALASQLATIHHIDLPLACLSASEYRELVGKYLRQPPADGKQLLLIADGLDESPNWLLKADVIPVQPPRHLRVICAARTTGEKDSLEKYLDELGWSKQVTICDKLENLSYDGFKNVLLKMGDSLKSIYEYDELVDRLYELSEHGDPLLTNLYVKELMFVGTPRSAALTLEYLKDVKPGYNSFFKRWFREQKEICRSRGENFDLEKIEPLLCMLSVALGPLSNDDLRTLFKDIFPSQVALMTAIRSVQRLLLSQIAIGTNTQGKEKVGYVFTHPRMKEYFGGEEWMSKADREKYTQSLVDYCRRRCEELKAGSLAKDEISPYIVQNWGEHLAKNVVVPDHELYGLVCEPWLRAWEHLTGTTGGFLTDVNRAARFARQAGKSGLGMYIRAILCHSSVASQGLNIDTKALLALTEANTISPPRAIDLAGSRVGVLIALREVLSKDWQDHVYELALKIARNKQDLEERARTLLIVAAYAPTAQKLLLLEEVYSIARDKGMVSILLDLVDHLPEDRWAETLSLALELVDSVQNHWKSVGLLRRIAQKLKGDQKISVLTKLLQEVSQLQGMNVGLILPGIAAEIPQGATSIILSFIQIPGVQSQLSTSSLTSLIDKLPDNAYTELSAVLESLNIQGKLIDALSNLQISPAKAPALYEVILSKAHNIANPNERASAFIAIAERYAQPKQQGILDQAIKAIAAFSDGSAQIDYWLRLADFYDESYRQSFLNWVLEIAKTFSNSGIRSNALYKIAQKFPIENRPEIMRHSLQSAEESSQWGTLEGLAESRTRCTEVIPQDAFESLIRLLKLAADSYSRSLGDMLSKLELRSFNGFQLQVIAETAIELVLHKYNGNLFFMPNAKETDSKAWYILPSRPQLRYVDGLRVGILRRFSTFLSTEKRQELFSRIIQPLQSIEDNEYFASLSQNVRYLTGFDDQSVSPDIKVWDTTLIQDRDRRTRLFIEIAKHLPADQRSSIIDFATYANSSIDVALSLAYLATPTQSRQIFRQAIQIAYESNNAWDCCRKLLIFVDNLPSNAKKYLISQIYALATTIESPEKRIDILVSVLDKLPSRLTIEASQEFSNTLAQIPTEVSRVHYRIKYLNLLPQEMRYEVLNITLEQVSNIPFGKDEYELSRAK